MSRKSEARVACNFCGWRLPYPVRGADERAIAKLMRHPSHHCLPLWRRLLRRLVPVMLRER